MAASDESGPSCAPRPRWVFKIVLILLVGTIAIGGWRGYGRVRKNHLAKQATQFLEHSDAQSAALVARRLLELEPSNLTACCVMAELAERAGRPKALEGRRKISAAEPAVARARTALRFGQAGLAEQVLDSIPATGRSGMQSHQLAGALALTHNQPAQAESLRGRAGRFA